MRSWNVSAEDIPNELLVTDSHQNLKVFDTETQQLVPVTSQKDTYHIYVCGITPYDSAHLGHAFTYLSFDLMIRALRLLGKKVNYVQNITDIDDPLFERAKRDGKNWEEIVNSQLDIYREDMQALNIIAPTSFVGVVENIEIIATDIASSISKNLTYTLGDQTYFKTKITDRSKMVLKYTDEELVAISRDRGGDPDREGKENKLDPVIWKKSLPSEPKWDYNFGEGRPGWHIECISLANKYADLPLDIQGGGKDLIFPHHSMCEEQTKSLFNKKLANVFCHVGMVAYKGSKMSKSKGNLVFVHELINQGVSPQVIRILLMSKKWTEDWEYDATCITSAEEILASLIANKERFLTQDKYNMVYELLLEDLNSPAIFEILQDNSTLTDSESNYRLDLVLRHLLGIVI